MVDFEVFFVAAVFFVADLVVLVVDFLATGVFSAVLTTGFSVVLLVVLVVSLTPVALAILCKEALRRAAVLGFKRSFLTALSSSDWALERFSAEGWLLNFLIASLIKRLIC